MRGSSLNRNGVLFYEYCCRILLLGNAFFKNLCQDYILAPFQIMRGGRGICILCNHHNAEPSLFLGDNDRKIKC